MREQGLDGCYTHHLTGVYSQFEMDRDDWRTVGEALLIGRRQHKSDQGFSRWFKANGFGSCACSDSGDIHRVTHSNAMWLAQNWDEVWVGLGPPYTAAVAASAAPDLSQPDRIRQAYREAKAATFQAEREHRNHESG